MKPIRRRITLPVFKFHLAVTIGGSEAEYLRSIRKRYGLDLNLHGAAGRAMQLGQEGGGSYYEVWVERWNWPDIVHELSHTTDQMLEERGIEDGETRAYMLGWLTDMVRRKFGRRG